MQIAKRGLAQLGAVMPERVLYDLDGVVNYLEVGAFMRRRGFDTPRRVATRFEVFDLVALEVGEKQVLYLEFGVAAGASMRYWSKLLRNPQTTLHGFDSFEGLPADWTFGCRAGECSTGGKIPEIGDERVAFFKGWFEDTLPAYSLPGHEVLVVNIDADLYTSTVTALGAVKQHLVPGPSYTSMSSITGQTRCGLSVSYWISQI